MSERTKLYLAGLIAALLAVQLAPFTAGHNLTADDNLYQYLALKLDAPGLIERAWDKVIFTQRYTQFLGYQLNYLGTVWIDLFPVRVLVVTVFGLCLLLIALNVRHHASPRAAALTMLTLPAGAPLAFHHMPPTSYPLLITLPLAAILAVRLRLCRPDRPYEEIPRTARIGGRTMEAICLATSEYMIIFGGGIMLLSSLSAAARRRPVTPRQRPTGRLLRDRRLRVDTVMVLAAILLQAATAQVIPGGGYHQTGLEIAPDDLLTVLTRHIAGGTTLGLFELNTSLIEPHHVAVSAVVAILVAAGTQLAFKQPGAVLQDRLLIPAGLALALVISTPIALSEKYQRWCFDRADCVYLDSRLAGLGVLVAIAGLLSLLATRIDTRTLRAGLTVTLTAIACVTALQNQQIAQRMTQVTAPWREARAYACAFPANAPMRDRRVLGEAPNQQAIPWHNDWLPAELAEYWQLYAQSRRAWGWQCPEPPDLNFRRVVDFSASNVAARPWLFGWHGPENWGVWSAGTTSALAFRRPGADSAPATLWLNVRIFDPPQEAIFKIDDKRGCRTVVESAQATIRLPLGASNGLTRIIVETPDARAPSEVGEGPDTRTIALGLESLRLAAAESPAAAGRASPSDRDHAHNRSTTVCQEIPAAR